MQRIVTKALEKQRKNEKQQDDERQQGDGTQQENGHDVSKNDAEARELAGRLEEWHLCVDEFSKRSLTAPSDKLSAMAGLAAVINDGTVGEYLAGIWSKNIAVGLVWGRVYSLLRPAPVYRAPSWSWASIDGNISSKLLLWPLTLMEDHARNSSWIDRYGPKLISQHMILQDPLNPYMGVLEASYIVVESAYGSISQLTGHLKGNNSFRIDLILDQSWAFDCPCCGPGRSRYTPPNEEEAKEAKSVADTFHNICIVLQGDAWRTENSTADMLILRCTDQAQNVFERVGYLRLSHDRIRRGYSKVLDPGPMHEEFDTIGLERKVMKLI